MIRREEKEGWILITQHDHAQLAWEVMRFWGNDRFVLPDPYDEVLFAIKEHDCGWIDWDSCPKLNPNTSYPVSFMEMSAEDQYEIWSRCYRSHADEHPYASSLIALHFARFNRKVLSKNPVNGLAKSLQQGMDKFISNNLNISYANSHLATIPKRVGINLRFLQIGDVLSLMLCRGLKSAEITGVPIDYTGSEVSIRIESEDGFDYTLSPYPFRQNLIELKIQAKRVDSGKFKSEGQYREVLNNSESKTLDFTIRKG